MFYDAGYRASPNATGRMFCGRLLISPHPVAAHHSTSSSATLNSRRPRFSRGLPRPEVRGLRHSRGQDGSADVRILNAIPTEKKPPALTAQTAASQQTLNFNSRPPPEQPPPDSFAASLLARSSAETGSSGNTLSCISFFLPPFPGAPKSESFCFESERLRYGREPHGVRRNRESRSWRTEELA